MYTMPSIPSHQKLPPLKNHTLCYYLIEVIICDPICLFCTNQTSSNYRLRIHPSYSFRAGGKEPPNNWHVHGSHGGRIPGNSAVFFRVMLLKDYDDVTIQLNPLSPRSWDDSKRHRKRVLPLINYGTFPFSLFLTLRRSVASVSSPSLLLRTPASHAFFKSSMVSLILSRHVQAWSISTWATRKAE